MEPISLKKIFIVASLEIIFLLIAFIFIGLGLKELKKKKNVLSNTVLVTIGIVLALVSLWCAKILLLY